jgi:hypothetical protein
MSNAIGITWTVDAAAGCCRTQSWKTRIGVLTKGVDGACGIGVRTRLLVDFTLLARSLVLRGDVVNTTISGRVANRTTYAKDF